MVLECKATKLLLSFTFEWAAEDFHHRLYFVSLLEPLWSLTAQEFRVAMFSRALLCKNRGKRPRNANLKSSQERSATFNHERWYKMGRVIPRRWDVARSLATQRSTWPSLPPPNPLPSEFQHLLHLTTLHFTYLYGHDAPPHRAEEYPKVNLLQPMPFLRP